jgi:beta-galactosidase GanA
MLTRLCQMGANAVSTIVPWSWHEPRAGVFDLTGATHPGRDVADFVDTCSTMGFRLIFRVAPYIGAGLLGGGVPGWLLQEHAEIYALRPDLQPWRDPASGSPLPSPEHPTYLKYVERWYRELTGVLAARQWPAGPLVALRVDGFTPDAPQSPSDEVHARWDYNPHVVNAQWPVWLRQQYAGIDALNAAWGTDYRSFNDAAFPRQPSDDESSPRHADAARFVTYAAAHLTIAGSIALTEEEMKTADALIRGVVW